MADRDQSALIGFEIPVARWLRGRLSETLRGALEPASARIYEFVERSVVARMMGEHQTERADHGRALWSLLTLETWLTDADRARHS